MRIVESEVGYDFLFKDGKDYYLSVYCEYSFFGGGVDIWLTEEEIASYLEKGRSYWIALNNEIRRSNPWSRTSNSEFKKREVTSETNRKMWLTVQGWRAMQIDGIRIFNTTDFEDGTMRYEFVMNDENAKIAVDNLLAWLDLTSTGVIVLRDLRDQGIEKDFVFRKEDFDRYKVEGTRPSLDAIRSGSLGKEMLEVLQANPDDKPIKRVVRGYIATRWER